MICLHCGYCCIFYDVIILKDYDQEPSEENAIYKRNNEICPHLAIINDQIICTAHGKKYFKDCPCDQYSQLESENLNCRTGDYVINNPKGKKIFDLIRKMNIPLVL